LRLRDQAPAWADSCCAPPRRSKANSTPANPASCTFEAASRLFGEERISNFAVLPQYYSWSKCDSKNVIQLGPNGVFQKWPFTHANRHDYFSPLKSSLSCLLFSFPRFSTRALDRFDPSSKSTLPIHSLCFRDIPHSNGTKINKINVFHTIAKFSCSAAIKNVNYNTDLQNLR